MKRRAMKTWGGWVIAVVIIVAVTIAAYYSTKMNGVEGFRHKPTHKQNTKKPKPIKPIQNKPNRPAAQPIPGNYTRPLPIPDITIMPVVDKK